MKKIEICGSEENISKSGKLQYCNETSVNLFEYISNSLHGFSCDNFEFCSYLNFSFTFSARKIYRKDHMWKSWTKDYLRPLREKQTLKHHARKASYPSSWKVEIFASNNQNRRKWPVGITEKLCPKREVSSVSPN